MGDQLQEGKFYWALPVLDADADQEWVNEPQPARYIGGDRWLWIGYETEDWPARWVGELVEPGKHASTQPAITPEALAALYEIGHMDDAPMGIDCESTYQLIVYAAGLSGLEVDQVKDGDKFKLVFKPKSGGQS